MGRFKCPLKFKSEACGYKGSVLECDKTPKSCCRLGREESLLAALLSQMPGRRWGRVHGSLVGRSRSPIVERRKVDGSVSVSRLY